MRQLLTDLTIVAPLVTFLVGISCFDRLSRFYKFFVLQAFVAFAAEVTGQVIHQYRGPENSYFFNWFIIVDLWLMSLPALLLLNGSLRRKDVLLITTVSLLILANIRKNNFRDFANWGLVASSIFICVLYIMVLYRTAFQVSQMTYRHPVFWICLGVLVYFGCTIPLMTSLHYLASHHPSVLATLFNINRVFDLLKYIFIAGAINLFAESNQNEGD